MLYQLRISMEQVTVLLGSRIFIHFKLLIMARQKGLIKLRGAIGDLTFFKTKDGYLARESGGVDRQRVLVDPAFARTRENAAEFGRSVLAGSLLVRSFRGILRKAVDGRLGSRMTQQMHKIQCTDFTSDRGFRHVKAGALELLQGFEFNSRSLLSGHLFVPISTSIDVVSGKMTVDVESFFPSALINAPFGATHYTLITAGSAVDFDGRTFAVSHLETIPVSLDAAESPAVHHVHAVSLEGSNCLFLVVGLCFFQEVGNGLYALYDGAHNPFCIVEVGY